MVFFFSVSASQRDSSSSKDNNPTAYGKNAIDLDAFKIGPYFDKAASKNVTALLGKTAYLNCRVKNLGNKTVSTLWHFQDILTCENNSERSFYQLEVWWTLNMSNFLNRLRTCKALRLLLFLLENCIKIPTLFCGNMACFNCFIKLRHWLLHHKVLNSPKNGEIAKQQKVNQRIYWKFKFNFICSHFRHWTIQKLNAKRWIQLQLRMLLFALNFISDIRSVPR